MNTARPMISLAVLMLASGSFDEAALDAAYATEKANLRARLAVDFDTVAVAFASWMGEPKQLNLVTIPVKHIVTVLWKRLEKAAEATRATAIANGETPDATLVPDAETDPDGYALAESHFEDTVKRYLRDDPSFFHLGNGRGASHVVVRAVPGEMVRNQDGSVKKRNDGTPIQRYRASKEEWDLIVAQRAIAATKQAAKKASKEAAGDTSPDSVDVEGSEIENPAELLAAAAE